MSSGKKITKCKRRSTIQKIEDKDALYISFSKRRNEVYAKASDLSTLCGTDIVVLIYSPTDRPYSFGSPTVESIVDRFLYNTDFLIFHNSSRHEQEHRKRAIQNLNHNLLETSHNIESQKQKKIKLEERLRMDTQGLEWIQELKDVVDLEALNLLEQSLWMLKAQVDRQVALSVGSSSTMAMPLDPICQVYDMIMMTKDETLVPNAPVNLSQD